VVEPLVDWGSVVRCDVEASMVARNPHMIPDGGGEL
jgi:hypothetical protein